MRLTIRAPFQPDHQAQVLISPGVSLGQLLASYAEQVVSAQVNGVFCDAWREHTLQPDDAVTLFIEPREFISLATLITAVVTAVVSAAISIALGYVIRALTPTKSQTEGKPEQVYGIAGLTNTTAQGTPKLLCYGERRVYGHILSTFVGVANDGASMNFGILYFMGEGEVQGMSQYQIDDVDVSQYPGVEAYTKLGGADNATIIHPDFDTFFSQVWTDGRQLPIAQPIIYQTKHANCHSAFLVLYTPFLRTDNGGFAFMTYSIEISTVAANSFVPHLGPLTWGDTSISPRFHLIPVIFPTDGHWLIRITIHDTSNAQQTPPTLYSVRELQFGSQLYPDSALLAFVGVASSQIQSFDSMRGSALMQGRKVKVWNGTSFTTQYTNKRAWILRDVLTEARAGLGHRIPESLFDDDAALAVQNYWDGEAATGSGIPHDQCDLLINDRRPAWDWLKLILSEGRAALIPSEGMLKLVVDQPGSPGLLYSMPGNIVEGSLTHTLGSGQGLLPNTLLLQFPDEADNYRPHLIRVRAEGTEAEPQREAPALTAYSLKRYEHAYWMARYQLLRQRIVKRRFAWQSPATAMVSEPLDRVSIAYDTSDFARGMSGFFSSDSTTTRLVLDRIVTLAPATTYTVLVRHQATNVIESRTVTTGAGQWGAIAPDTALDTAPALGDLWAIGVLGTTLLPLVIEEVSQESDGTYRLTASEYQASLYDFPYDAELPDPPIPPPTPPPPAPPPGSTMPSAVVLSGVFGGSGTISLTWTPTVLAEGDTLLRYEVYRSLDTPDQALFFAAEGAEEHSSLTSQLYNAWFYVRAEATIGGHGPFSNAVHTDWQFSESDTPEET